MRFRSSVDQLHHHHIHHEAAVVDCPLCGSGPLGSHPICHWWQWCVLCWQVAMAGITAEVQQPQLWCFPHLCWLARYCCPLCRIIHVSIHKSHVMCSTCDKIFWFQGHLRCGRHLTQGYFVSPLLHCFFHLNINSYCCKGKIATNQICTFRIILSSLIL